MSSPEAGFLHAITTDRRDDTARLVYADWLDDAGQPGRAEYLRLQVELVRSWWYDNPCTDLFARLADLSKQLDAAWIATVRRCTTPAPLLNVEEVFPNLRGSAKTTVRLHPRPGEAPIDASKIGGMFLWPKQEPWPTCSVHNIPYVAVLQVRKEDVPELDFPPDKDLFQLLWCPKRHDEEENRWCPKPAIYWRNRSDATQLRKRPPKWKQRWDLYDEEDDAIPDACRIHPERVTEFPGHLPLDYPVVDHLLPPAFLAVVELVRGLPKVGELGPPTYADVVFSSWCSKAVGSKIGGYPSWNHREAYPQCACGADMEYLLSLESLEYDVNSWGRWVPIEDRPILHATEYCDRLVIDAPHGCVFGRHDTLNVFVCRKHSAWPARASID